MFKFAKMHGLGNDFIVIDGINQKISLTANQISSLADRHRGIGFDQCLIVEKSTNSDIDFNYKIYNADGQEVGQCGNGARCLATFIRALGLSTKDRLIVATKTTKMHLQIEADGSVTVTLDKPKFTPNAIPILATKQQEFYLITLDFNINCNVHALSVGNPHAVLLVDNFDDGEVMLLGKKISQHPIFPEQVNVGFMKIVTDSHIQLRVYERGCGETQACGSGAVAAAAAGILYHNLANTVTVSLPGGDLKVFWPQARENIYLNGPTQFVFMGEIETICE